MKQVVLIIIDALASRVVGPALDEGKLPAFQALAEAGSLDLNSIAVFPSITPAATASIITGHYPRKHGIVGGHWYDAEQNKVLYFGTDIPIIWQQGVGEFFEDFLFRLNHERLRSTTLYQHVERAGYKAAGINYLYYRGDTPHEVNDNLLLKLLPGVDLSGQVSGPSILRIGDFVVPDRSVMDEDLEADGVLNRYGMQDRHTAQTLLYLARHGTLPNLTVAYFPDNDFASHEDGPQQAIGVLQQVDTWLGDLIDSAGGIERLLEHMCLVISGDHSQADMHPDEPVGIDISSVLADYRIVKPGASWENDEDLVVCPNMRAACIYLRDPTVERLDHLIHDLLADARIDQVIWSGELLQSREPGLYVATRDRGRLHFWSASDGPQTARDVYGCPWSWQGDLAAVDGQLSDEGIIHFPTYPNAFERITCAHQASEGVHLWVTALPGYEFSLPEISPHRGGAHGALHVLDSQSPLLVAGAPEGVAMPRHPRSVDIVPLCLEVLGIEPELPVGASHV